MSKGILSGITSRGLGWVCALAAPLLAIKAARLLAKTR
jgi:hypothetical protein